MLFLGSFPPPKMRWSMDFFYPNFTNDFWRIMGLIHFDDKTYFEAHDEKCFDKARIMEFAVSKGLAFFDTATKVNRLKGNASDNFLEIIEPTDIGALLDAMPLCCRLITTGGKASEELQKQLSTASGLLEGECVPMPQIGTSITLNAFGRKIEWWRMPSSSRAYPLKLEKKAEEYRKLF